MFAAREVEGPRPRLRPLLALGSFLDVRQCEEVEELADIVSELSRVAHLDVAVDRVAVSASDALPLDEARLDEVGDDSLGGAFGDPDVEGDIAQPDLGVVGDAKEHLGVVGDEPPPVLRLLFT
jgi:hypothetical protein